MVTVLGMLGVLFVVAAVVDIRGRHRHVGTVERPALPAPTHPQP